MFELNSTERPPGSQMGTVLPPGPEVSLVFVPRVKSKLHRSVPKPSLLTIGRMPWVPSGDSAGPCKYPVSRGSPRLPYRSNHVSA